MSLPSVAVSQSPEERFREYLASRPKPQRFTEQQRELVEHVFQKHSHFDAEQLVEELHAAGKSASRATVYRTLTKLVDAGLLRKIEHGQRTIFDHDYGYPWHEHFICEQCDKIIEFQHPGIEALLNEVAAQHQFRPAGHTLVVRGACADCTAKTAAQRRRLVM